jgi:hypothetical protein
MLKRAAPSAALVAALVAGAAVLAVTSTARGASQRKQAAAIDVTQTCPNRVPPRSSINVQAVVANTGDVVLDITVIVGDAGSPLDSSDDFIPQYQSGDTNNDGNLDPGERWAYAGSYTVPDEDVTNIVSVEAVAPGDIAVGDLAPCDTDVIQEPVPGVIVGAKEVSGKVRVRRPGKAEFVELEGTTEIPVGSQVDTRKGTISLEAGLGGGRTNTAQFYDGLFTILQGRARNSLMTLRLDGGNFRLCRRGSLSTLRADAKSKRPVRRLWGSGKGRFGTRGRYSSATVRGTKWLVQDQCNGTLTRVLRGIVRVRDFRLRKTIDVRAGGRYLAKAPGA